MTARTPSMIGDPVDPALDFRPENLSGGPPLPANLSETDFWSSARKFTAKLAALAKVSWRAEPFEIAIITRGGVKEMLVKELTVMPFGSPDT